MNITENEIKAMPLAELQKFVLDLRTVPMSDKFYPTAKALITVATDQKKWKEPMKVKVKALQNVKVNGRGVNKDQETEIFEHEYLALARFFELTEVPKAEDDSEKDETKKGKKDKGTGGALSVLLAFFTFLAFGLSAAHAQNQTTLIGGPGQYWVVAIPGLTNGNTQNWQGTTNFFGQTTTTNTIISPNITNINGTITIGYTTNNIITTNVPGLVNVNAYDSFDIQWGSALIAAGTTTNTLSFSSSDDNVNFVTNGLGAFTSVNAGTALVQGHTNITFYKSGWFRFDTWNTGGGTLTNPYVRITRKANNAGP